MLQDVAYYQDMRIDAHIRVCFLCGRKLGKHPILADTRDDQLVFIGRECSKLVERAGENGYGGKDWRPGYVKVYALKEKIT